MPARPTTWETSSSGRWNSSWARNVPTNFGLEFDFHVILGIFYMRHVTDGCTSPPKEGLKIRRLRPGLNPRTWVPKASTLTARPPKPLEYRNMWGEMLDRTYLRTGFRRIYGPVVRQTAQWIHEIISWRVAKKPLIVFAIVTIGFCCASLLYGGRLSAVCIAIG
jgi:hypothetical protein